MYVKYSEQDKEIFFKCLNDYKNAIEGRDGLSIIMEAVKVIRASKNVPKSYRRYINQAMRRGGQLNREDNLDW